MNTYDQARNHAVFGIEKALIAHGKREVYSIDDELEQYELLISKLELPSNTLLLLTLEFWSGWADAAIHDWKYYEPIKENDWPVYAEVLLENLRSNTEVTDAVIKQHFCVYHSEGIFTKLLGLFRVVVKMANSLIECKHLGAKNLTIRCRATIYPSVA